ncbi:MAG: hypothetical protein MJ124_08475 [Lachnospiraceae bacterium]|nr:hypothetical protein [Lachnospiraceae bacterium]
MNNSQNLAGYLRLMKDILARKRTAMNKIIDYTNAQAKVLAAEEFDDEAFDDYIGLKQAEIDKINELDDGFTAVYNKIEGDLKNNSKEFESIIKEIQGIITEVTDMSVKIGMLEKKNWDAFEKRRNEIKRTVKTFGVNRQTASSYYKNMSGVGGEAGPVFMDQKK